MDLTMTQGFFAVLGVVAALVVLWAMFRKKEEPSCVDCEGWENVGYVDAGKCPEKSDVVIIDPTTEKPISDAEVADILNILANQRDENVVKVPAPVVAPTVVAPVVPAVKKAKKAKTGVKKPRAKKTK